ncbi:hypothetical protein G5B30_16245 [Sphingobacterium sp. SGG-5]|uniref:hypothetical protein n=1 Tax=Sphingobacterium sp. SGG-5 TaxID=2710881 RepID=UPI0013EC01C1|nr:hypothetical protein [Sphingobacterium sp. SGG-5]NGM63460.1 hypothetical protein [Sphingobacterium sp. SGG-5]
MKIKSLIFLLSIVTLVISGCSKDEDGGDKVSGVKVTVTVEGIEQEDSFYISFFGRDRSEKKLSWKVNDQMMEAHSDIELDNDDFLSGTTTYIGEAVDVESATIAVAASAVEDNSYTVSIKIEEDGEVVHHVNKTITKDEGIAMHNYVVGNMIRLD